MHALVTQRVPFVLAGSIRDDGPLPGVYSDTLQAQDAMREHTVKATGAIFVATALHAIAVGNMLPAFHLCDGAPAPLMTICVDQTEFVVNKLKDRGTHQAYGVVTNAQDFMHVLRFYTEQWEQGGLDRPARRTPAGLGSPAAVAEVLPPAEVDGVWVFSPLRHEGRSGAPRCSPGWTATAGGSTPRATCSRSRARSAASSRRRCRRSAAGRSSALAQLVQDAHKRIDDEQPPTPVAPEPWFPRSGRGARRWPASLGPKGAALLDRFRRYLRDHHQPVTRQRDLVAQVVFLSEEHPSRRRHPPPLKERGEAVGTATVYRTLEVLVESGLVRAHDFGEGFKRYEPMPAQAHHEHLICERCGTRGRVSERAAGAHAAGHRRRARLPALSATGSRSTACAASAAGGSWWCRRRLMNEPAALGVAVAFAAGLLSFLSPCVLPLVPSYVGFLTGMTAAGGGRRRAWPCCTRCSSSPASPSSSSCSAPAPPRSAARSTTTRSGSSGSAAC